LCGGLNSPLFVAAPFAATRLVDGQIKQNPGGHSTHRGFKLLFRDSRFNALDLASLDALHANANANVLAVDGGANRLQVRAEGALIANM
jgi:hypothetical protein